MSEHHWTTTHIPATPKDPSEVTCTACGTVAIQFGQGTRYPVEAVAKALFGRILPESMPHTPEVCEDTTLSEMRDPFPKRTPQTWTKAICRVLGIASERVGIRAREGSSPPMSNVPVITIDGRPLGIAIHDFARDEPGKSRYGLVDAIQQEARAIDGQSST